MIEMFVDEINAQVRRVPASEVLLSPPSGVLELIEIDLMPGKLEFTLRMPLETAEDLFNALAVHFMGDEG